MPIQEKRNIASLQSELILDARAELAEGPAWDARVGVLYWVDIHAGHLHTFDPRDGNDRRLELGAPLGCVAPRRTGGLVAALKSGFATLDPAGGGLGPLADPEAHLPGNRFNDGKCDPAGRFLAGSMDDAEQLASGSLYSLSPGGELKTLLTGLRISNGLAWSPDGGTFYHIDTPTRRVMAYDYDLKSGEIANPRPAVSVPPALGWPDGMTSDAEGRLWVAMWGGGRVARFDPADGRLLAEVPVPARHVSACVFGGADLNELYVTTARKRLSAAELVAQPHSGGLFRVHTDVQGMPTYEFSG
jgi:sugar lactone lactonase YvrE